MNADLLYGIMNKIGYIFFSDSQGSDNIKGGDQYADA